MVGIVKISGECFWFFLCHDFTEELIDRRIIGRMHGWMEWGGGGGGLAVKWKSVDMKINTVMKNNLICSWTNDFI